MKKSGTIVRYTTEDIEQMLKRDGEQTDWRHLDTLTEEDLEASIDHDDEGEFDWEHATVGIPSPKHQLTIRLDLDIIDWFKRQGPRYQTRMNEVLRRYVEAQQGRTKRRK